MSNDWSTEELRASVKAYLEMLGKERRGESYTKKRYYEELSGRFGRTAKAFEYRMQNISYVMTLLGREWLAGLKPAKNVGRKVGSEIESLIAETEARPAGHKVEFEIAVREEAEKPNRAMPGGNRAPRVSSLSVAQFERDPAVKAWVLNNADGKCECCQKPAPFKNSDGQPFLEVHHVRQLADNGSDTVANAVALCPNCHREIHYGEHARELALRLYSSVTRLVRE